MSSKLFAVTFWALVFVCGARMVYADPQLWARAVGALLLLYWVGILGVWLFVEAR